MYRARDPKLNRDVALEVLVRSFSSGPSEDVLKQAAGYEAGGREA
jgi:hypothetical protein